MDANKMLDLIAIQMQLLDWNRAQPQPPILIGHEYGVATEVLRIMSCAPQTDEPQNVARIEWDGEGLPPAGTACDIRQTTLPNEWASATVLFVGDRRVFYRTADGDEMSRPINFLLFRKIRTPEQIAADEREHGIRNACTDISKALSELHEAEEPTAVAIIEAMIDAGYRKP